MTDYISDLISLGAPFAKVTDVITDDDTKYVFHRKERLLYVLFYMRLKNEIQRPAHQAD